MTHRVRIVRKTKSNAQMMLNWARMMTLVTRIFYRPQIEANLSYMQELKAAESKKRMEVLEARKQKTSNDVVLGDLKIEEQKMKLELLRRELEIRGLAKPPTDNGERF